MQPVRLTLSSNAHVDFYIQLDELGFPDYQIFGQIYYFANVFLN